MKAEAPPGAPRAPAAATIPASAPASTSLACTPAGTPASTMAGEVDAALPESELPEFDLPESDVPDAELLARFRAGELAAFDRLYTRHRTPLYGFLVRLLGNRALADDVFQDLWLQVIEHAGDFRAGGNVRAWLFTLARSRALDRLRRETVRSGGGRDPDARGSQPNPAGGADAYTFDSVSGMVQDMGAEMAADTGDLPETARLRAERAALLRGALAQLPEEQRLVFLMREEGELSLPEAAVALGIPYETAKSRYRYALARLRDLFGLGAGARR